MERTGGVNVKQGIARIMAEPHPHQLIGILPAIPQHPRAQGIAGFGIPGGFLVGGFRLGRKNRLPPIAEDFAESPPGGMLG